MLHMCVLHIRYHLWILVICGTGMLHQTWTLWRLNKRKPICFYTRRQRMFWRAIAVASILLVPLVLLTPSWYPKLGFMLLLLHYPTYSSSWKTLAAGALCLLMILVIPIVWLGESVRDTTVGLLAILAIYLILLLLRQSFFIKSRIVWQVRRCQLRSFDPGAPGNVCGNVIMFMNWVSQIVMLTHATMVSCHIRRCLFKTSRL